MAIKKRIVKRKRVSAKRRVAGARKKNTRKAVRIWTSNLIRDQELKLEELSKFSGEVLDQATATLKGAVPASRRRALRDIVNGIADAWAITAKASAAAVRHARREGIPFAKRDLMLLNKRLLSLEKDFIRTLEQYSRRLTGDIGAEAEDLVVRIRKTGTAIQPAIKNAGKVIADQSVDVVGELATTGRNIIEWLISGAGEVFTDLGQEITARTPRRRTKKR
jgi:hypothetical protein